MVGVDVEVVGDFSRERIAIWVEADLDFDVVLGGDPVVLAASEVTVLVEGIVDVVLVVVGSRSMEVVGDFI